MIDDRFPLGAPINRPPPERVWVPIPNRPGWLKHRESGREIYLEQSKPKPMPPFSGL